MGYVDFNIITVKQIYLQLLSQFNLPEDVIQKCREKSNQNLFLNLESQLYFQNFTDKTNCAKPISAELVSAQTFADQALDKKLKDTVKKQSDLSQVADKPSSDHVKFLTLDEDIPLSIEIDLKLDSPQDNLRIIYKNSLFNFQTATWENYLKRSFSTHQQQNQILA